MPKMKEEVIYEKLLKIVPDLEQLCSSAAEAVKFKSSGMMDFNVDFLGKHKEGWMIACSHYYKHQCGDMIADPDMEMFVDFTRKMASAISFQDIMSYQHIDGAKDARSKMALKNSMNEFLVQWLENVLNQGYKREGC